MSHKHNVYDTDTHFSINPITRTIKNESSSKTSLMQYDHNSERFTFEMPRYIEEHDMSLCNLAQVHFLNIDAKTKETNADVYDVEDLQISPDGDDVVICSWIISRNATLYAGSLHFVLRFACVDDEGNLSYIWNTAVYTGISVSDGINNGDIIEEEYSDILAAWEARFLYLEENMTGASPEVVENAVNKYFDKHPVATSPNLLDNWYFADSINQRDGYVVPTGTPLYSDTALSNFVANCTYYNPVVGRTSDYCKIEDALYPENYYYTPASAAVRGYVGAGYTIDRWAADTNNVVLLQDNGIRVNFSGTFTAIAQHIEKPSALSGRTVTFSAIIDSVVSGFTRLAVYCNSSLFASSSWSKSSGVQTLTFDVPDGCQAMRVCIQGDSASAAHVIAAVKLELGSKQTLAHQDASGSWVLNDIPDKGAELAKCQRYQLSLFESIGAYGTLGFARVSGVSVKTAEMIVPIPVTMRATPTLTTGSAAFQLYSSESEYAAVTSIAFSAIAPGFVRLYIVVGKELTGGNMYVLRKTTDDLVLLDANL